jgi:hypothetical protein
MAALINSTKTITIILMAFGMAGFRTERSLCLSSTTFGFYTANLKQTSGPFDFG